MNLTHSPTSTENTDTARHSIDLVNWIEASVYVEKTVKQSGNIANSSNREYNTLDNICSMDLPSPKYSLIPV